MAHRTNRREPYFLSKSLTMDELWVKNRLEFAHRYRITDKSAWVLDALFLPADPGLVEVIVPSPYYLLEDGFGKARVKQGQEWLQNVYTFEPMDLAYIHDRACCVSIAPRGSGKSTLGYHMLATKSFIPRAYAVSCTDADDGCFHAVVENVQDHFDEDYFWMIIRDQKVAQREYYKGLETKPPYFFDPRAIAVEDDVSTEPAVRDSRVLAKIATESRHSQFQNLAFFHRMNVVVPLFRDNADWVILFPQDDPENLKRIWEQWCGFIPADHFMQIMSWLKSQKYMVLFVDCVNRHFPAMARIRWFRARVPEQVDRLVCAQDPDDRSKPLRFAWRMGEFWDGKGLTDQEVQRQYTEQIRRQNEDIFHPSPISLSQLYINRRARKQEQKNYQWEEKEGEALQQLQLDENVPPTLGQTGPSG
jgi:hypothetical protein